MRPIGWYFDFVSPYSYIAFKRLHELPGDVQVKLKRVLFAGLLSHFGQKGPAEIAAKRRWTYRWCTWWAKELGIPFRFPASHPFNPLHHLRLAIAAGVTPQNVGRIFDAIWTTGTEAADPAAFKALAQALGVDEARLAAQEVKDARWAPNTWPGPKRPLSGPWRSTPGTRSAQPGRVRAPGLPGL